MNIVNVISPVRNNKCILCVLSLTTVLLVLLVSLHSSSFTRIKTWKATIPHPKEEEEELFLRSPLQDQPPGYHPIVTCLVMTSPGHLQDRARHVGATWGLEDEDEDEDEEEEERQHHFPCSNTIFVTSEHHPSLRKVIYTKYASYEELWGKVLDAFRTVNVTTADWFFKVDDDTFVIYPRLQQLLARFDSDEPVLLGFNLIHTLRDGKEVEYMSGGAGYLLSAPAVRMLQNTHLEECQYPGATSYEDVNMGICMTALGVRFGDTRDPLGRPVFLPCPPWIFFYPDHSLHPDYKWIDLNSKYPVKFGTRHLSDQVVSFHEIRNPKDFYILQYLSQHVHIRRPSEVTPFRKFGSRP